MPCIALLTDFEAQDWFVGTMKGVIASIDPGAAVVDISHAVPPGDIRAGAFMLMASHNYFPQGTIFVAVVDPGVGGSRDPLLAESGGRLYLGPDNGILSFALTGKKRRIRVLENPDLRLPNPGNTFHGRDVFAPAAAHLAKGVACATFGRLKSSMVELPWPRPVRRQGALLGEILYIDRFGNAITNIPAARLRSGSGKSRHVVMGESKIPVKAFYSQVAAGKPLALIGSCGLLEISVNAGNAAERFGLKVGDSMRLL